METTPKKKLPLVARILLYGAGGFVALIIIVALFMPKTKASNTPAPTGPKAIIADAMPSGCTYGWDSVAHVAILGKKIDDFMDEPSMMRDHFNRGINFAREVFAKDTSIRYVEFVTRLKRKDDNGNDTYQEVLRHRFDRVPFMQINWDNLNGDPILTQIGKCCVDGTSFVVQWLANRLTVDDMRKITYSS